MATKKAGPIFHVGFNHWGSLDDFEALTNINNARYQTEDLGPIFKDKSVSDHHFTIKLKQGANKISVGPKFSKTLRSQKKLVKGIIDTGAQSICLRDKICKDIGMPKIGNIRTYGANAAGEAHVYQGSLSLFKDQVSFKKVTIIGLPMPTGVDALIGWPIIKLGTLVLTDGRELEFDFNL